MYATIASPLTDLLKKDSFRWTKVADTTFLQLKTVMTSASILALRNFAEPFAVETDASCSRVEAILSQKGHPITYLSKKISLR